MEFVRDALTSDANKMAFPLHSFERILSDICKKGTQKGFTTVPEFTLTYQKNKKTKRRKKPDVAWLATKEGYNGNVLHRIVAVFELEGFNVPETTIALHSKVYPKIWRHLPPKFLCYVPLYSVALHRPGYGGAPDAVKTKLEEREGWAKYYGGKVKVCDGRHRVWLNEAAIAAVTKANQWKGQQ